MPLSEHQQELFDHWTRYMPAHPDYIADAIKRHFERAPWDRDEMGPQLRAAWIQLKEAGSGQP